MAENIVELVGNLGAGKSTVGEHLARMGVRVDSPSQLLSTGAPMGRMPMRQGLGIVSDAALTSLLSPTLAAAMIGFLWASKPTAWRARQMLIIAGLMPRLRRVHSGLKDTVILEEGIIHRLAAVPMPGPQSPDPTSVVARGLRGRVDRLVHLHCDAEVAFKRMRERQRTEAKMEAWPETIARQAHKVSEEIIDRALAAAREMAVPILKVDSTETPPEENARVIAAWLAKPAPR